MQAPQGPSGLESMAGVHGRRQAFFPPGKGLGGSSPLLPEGTPGEGVLRDKKNHDGKKLSVCTGVCECGAMYQGHIPDYDS